MTDLVRCFKCGNDVLADGHVHLTAYGYACLRCLEGMPNDELRATQQMTLLAQEIVERGDVTDG